MSDDGFFREVDEELRSARAKQIWERYGTWIVVAAVVIVLAVSANAIYDWNTKRNAQAAGDKLLAAVRLSEGDKRDEAATVLRELADDAPEVYRTLARMRLAAELSSTEPAEAIALFDAVADDADADSEQRTIARLRAGLLMVDQGSVAEVERRLVQLSGPTAPYRATAREGLGLAYWKANDLEPAFQQFSAIADDDQAPRGVSQRATLMLELIAGRGGPTRSPIPAPTTPTPTATSPTSEGD